MARMRVRRFVPQRRAPSLRLILQVAGLVLLAMLILPYVLVRGRILPAGVCVDSGAWPISPESVRLLVDETAYDTASAHRVVRQEIFDAMLSMVRDAKTFVCLDLFLWNSWKGRTAGGDRRLAEELAEALVAKKRSSPDVTILVLTDPINRIYGHHEEPFYRQMAENGIPVVFTDLDRLRDSNPLYTTLTRFYGPFIDFLPLLPRGLERPCFGNPFQSGGPPVSARQMLRLAHFKANHRKVAIADSESGAFRMLVCSFNPADASSAHSNLGLWIEGPIAAKAAESELECAGWSAESPDRILQPAPGAATNAIRRLKDRLQVPSAPEAAAGGASAECLTEGAIQKRLLSLLDDAGKGDEVRIALFYLSDRAVIGGLLQAARAGASVRMILDANRDAFGRTKNGIPNRPVAAELMRAAAKESLDVRIRWADTHGEQFHIKAVSLSNPARGKAEFLCGSANWTRRNLRNLNLETDVHLSGLPGTTGAFNAYFDRLWANGDGLAHTVDYQAFEETGWRLRGKTVLYRMQELTGLSSF